MYRSAEPTLYLRLTRPSGMFKLKRSMTRAPTGKMQEREQAACVFGLVVNVLHWRWVAMYLGLDTPKFCACSRNRLSTVKQILSSTAQCRLVSLDPHGPQTGELRSQGRLRRGGCHGISLERIVSTTLWHQLEGGL